MLRRQVIKCLENHGIKWQIRNDEIFCIDSWIDTKDQEHYEMWIQAPVTVHQMREFLQYDRI